VTLKGDFDALQQEVNADKEQVDEARRRRDIFRDALGPQEDVAETIPSGSLARGSHADPIHDVDLVVVFEADAYSHWGEPGASADNALGVVQSRVRELLGASEGTCGNEVRLASPRNHAVKCFLDDPDDPDAFTVDVMPALRHPEGGLLVPESASKDWIRTDPEHLIGLVGQRHADWNEFVKLVRVLKRWNQDHGKFFKSLTIEVLALKCLSQAERPEALARFFAAAHSVVDEPICDPAGLCGEIQPDLDRDAARALLWDAADSSWKALEAEAADDEEEARVLWHSVLGDAFPKPSGAGSGGGGGAGAAGGGVVAALPSVVPRRPRPVIDAPQG
jgi:hypothetical protein